MARARDHLPPPASYDGDFYAWALEQAALLRARRFAELDIQNLAEEVEDLARRHADALESRLATLLSHLLKWELQPSGRSWSWAGTIRRERQAIARLLQRNPGLGPRRGELFVDAYADARATAAIDTDRPVGSFPATCPYTLAQATDWNFWPGDPWPEGDPSDPRG